MSARELIQLLAINCDDLHAEVNFFIDANQEKLYIRLNNSEDFELGKI